MSNNATEISEMQDPLPIKKESPQDESTDSKALKSLFKTTLEIRNFEINQLVQRNNYFMIFQGVLFAGIIQSSHTIPIVSFLTCFAGLTVSLYQVRMAAGAKFWQEYWEAALTKTEAMLLSKVYRDMINGETDRSGLIYLFHDNLEIYHSMVKSRLSQHGCDFINSLILKRYSVSRIPIYVAIVLSIIWFLLTISTLREYSPFGVPSFITGFKVK